MHTLQITKIGKKCYFVPFNYKQTLCKYILMYINMIQTSSIKYIYLVAESTNLFLATFAWNGNIKSTF